MTDLKLVPKPEGFELRDKRSDKTGLGKDWEVQDALYSASQECKRVGATDVMILWTEVDAEGNTYTRSRFSGAPDAGLRLLINGLGRNMGWQK